MPGSNCSRKQEHSNILLTSRTTSGPSTRLSYPRSAAHNRPTSSLSENLVHPTTPIFSMTQSDSQWLNTHTSAIIIPSRFIWGQATKLKLCIGDPKLPVISQANLSGCKPSIQSMKMTSCLKECATSFTGKIKPQSQISRSTIAISYNSQQASVNGN